MKIRFGEISKFRWNKSLVYRVCYYCAYMRFNLLNTFIDAIERLKDHRFPHIEMSLKDFCAGVSDNSRVQCILDCPTVDGAKPDFIK